MISKRILMALFASAAWGQNWHSLPSFRFEARQQASAYDADYQKGLSELDARQWEEAMKAFNASASHGGANASAALYWKAYAQSRAARSEAALLTIHQLREKYPASRWIKDARALELEVRAKAGAPVSPTAEQDPDLKLLAVTALMQSDPSAAFPVVEKLLSGGSPKQVKEQALFVLTQSSLPQASKLLTNIASGSADPALQIRAIHLMGLAGDDDARKTLASLYKMSSDVRIKRAILQSYMQADSRGLLLEAAKTESDPELRADAIRQLALTGGEEQLWQLYKSSVRIEDKKAILQSMILNGESARLAEVARTDSNPELRAAAVQSLGLGDGRGDLLISIFENDKDAKVRRAALNSLFLQQNGKALVELARREKDPMTKKEIVSRMMLVHSKEVTDYLKELAR